MTAPYSGGCACGAIRYTVTAEPFVSYACHCTECQKRTASAFGVSLQVPAESVTVEKGTAKTYRRMGDTGNPLEIHFCGDCSSSLFSKPEAWPHLTVVYAGTLDDPSWVPIKANIWTDSALPWVHMEPGTERFPRAPDFSKYFAPKD